MFDHRRVADALARSGHELRQIVGEGRRRTVAGGVVDPKRNDQKIRGFGRDAVTALLLWGKRRGASWAHLPVAKDNVAGLALYNGLGFRTELYRYHYRVLP